MSNVSNGPRSDAGPTEVSGVRRFRKKPVEIEAVQFKAGTGVEVARWCGGRYHEEAKPSDPLDVYRWVEIPTLEGNMRASLNDWIIRGVQGEFYPCKPTIFAATYDEVAA